MLSRWFGRIRRVAAVAPHDRERVLKIHGTGRSVRSIAMPVKASRSAVWRILLSRKDALAGEARNKRQSERHQGAVRK
jgi:hypothetical protein